MLQNARAKFVPLFCEYLICTSLAIDVLYLLKMFFTRWYVSNGMTDEVIEKLRRIAKINRRKPDPRVYDVFAVSRSNTVLKAHINTLFI